MKTLLLSLALLPRCSGATIEGDRVVVEGECTTVRKVIPPTAPSIDWYLLVETDDGSLKVEPVFFVDTKGCE